jgi:eukaryotic translation initiation factor 2C
MPSQYSHVKHNELPQIRKAFEKAVKECKRADPPQLKLTAVVVAKRHNTRDFPQPSEKMPNNGNCRPGTLVDTGATNPYFSDFFLQSHDGIKGAAIPAHYFTLVDEMGMGEVQLQDFVSTHSSSELPMLTPH